MGRKAPPATMAQLELLIRHLQAFSLRLAVLEARHANVDTLRPTTQGIFLAQGVAAPPAPLGPLPDCPVVVEQAVPAPAASAAPTLPASRP